MDPDLPHPLNQSAGIAAQLLCTAGSLFGNVRNLYPELDSRFGMPSVTDGAHQLRLQEHRDDAAAADTSTSLQLLHRSDKAKMEHDSAYASSVEKTSWLSNDVFEVILRASLSKISRVRLRPPVR
jgi:hypothetical protein